MMDQSVDHSGRHLLVVKDRNPPGELQIGREHDAFRLIAVGDYLEQEPGSIAIYRYVTPFVEYEQILF